MDISKACTPFGHIETADLQLLNTPRMDIVMSSLQSMPVGACIGMDKLAIMLSETMPHMVSLASWYESIRDCFKERYRERSRDFKKIKDKSGKLIIVRLN